MQPLLELANIGYQIGALGILIFTVAYLVVVKKWWKDALGLVTGLILITISGVLVTSTVRMIQPDMPPWFFWVRLGVFWCFGLAVWSGIGLFIWAQFFAPRIKDRTTRREQQG